MPASLASGDVLRSSLRGLAVAALLIMPRMAAAAGPLNIVLEDQFRNRRGTEQLRGDVVVLVYADRHAAEKALEIGRRLHLRFHPTADGAAEGEWSRQPVVSPPGWPVGAAAPDVHVVPVACVPEVPKPLHAVARSRLRKESPHVAVWLDFDDVLKQTFGAVAGEPNIAVIDTAGAAHGTMSGMVDGRRFEDLVGVIDELRLRARPDTRTAVVPAAAIR